MRVPIVTELLRQAGVTGPGVVAHAVAPTRSARTRTAPCDKLGIVREHPGPSCCPKADDVPWRTVHVCECDCEAHGHERDGDRVVTRDRDCETCPHYEARPDG